MPNGLNRHGAVLRRSTPNKTMIAFVVAFIG
jgi:hypothetical protein